MMDDVNGAARWAHRSEVRRHLQLRLERAEAEVALCRSQLISMSRRHPSLRDFEA